MVNLLEQLATVLVAQVPMAASNALFEMPRVGALDQPVGIVVGFQHQGMAVLQAGAYQLGGGSAVGADTQTQPAMFQDESHGVRRIVGEREGVDDQIPDGERASRLN